MIRQQHDSPNVIGPGTARVAINGDTPPLEPEMPGMMGQGPKAPLSNPLSERLERQSEEFGGPETGGFPAKDEDDEPDGLMPVGYDFLARG